jgi:succinate dehydrogenase flavin-adding protein (antitoxin of CptAB toxin-antitoxin module)
MNNENPKIPAAACTIISYLEHISKEQYCASWLTDIEHSIWEHLINPDPPPDTDRFWDWPGNELEQLRKLAAECKGWVRFNEQATDFFDSRLFVPMDEWVQRHAAHTGKKMTEDQRQRFERFMAGPEQALKELSDRQRKLQDHIAAIVLAIQASGRTEVHQDFLEVLQMIPSELRGCPDCGTHPGGVHHPKCKSLTYEKVRSETVYDAFIEKIPWT